MHKQKRRRERAKGKRKSLSELLHIFEVWSECFFWKPPPCSSSSLKRGWIRRKTDTRWAGTAAPFEQDTCLTGLSGRTGRLDDSFHYFQPWRTDLPFSHLYCHFFWVFSVTKGLFTWLDFSFWKQQVAHVVKYLAAERKVETQVEILLANFVFLKF